MELVLVLKVFFGDFLNTTSLVACFYVYRCDDNMLILIFILPLISKFVPPADHVPNCKSVMFG